jgi:hypothetical protein
MKSYKLSEYDLELILCLLKDRKQKYGMLDVKEKAFAEKLGIWSDILKPYWELRNEVRKNG